MIAAGVTENQGLDNLALFVLGVVAARDNGFSNTNGGTGFSVHGLLGRNNDQRIDGQNNNDNSIGGLGLFASDTEFGARRNLSQDAPTNIANLALFKNIKMNERASLDLTRLSRTCLIIPTSRASIPISKTPGSRRVSRLHLLVLLIPA